MTSRTFNYSGEWERFNVPADVKILDITVKGAGSGSREGGLVTGKMRVNPKEDLWILVGEAGKTRHGSGNHQAGSTAVGGGGAGGDGKGNGEGGNGGGGASAIRLATKGGKIRVVAGGAGGSGGGTGATGGTGGGLTGQIGDSGSGEPEVAEAATGGSQSQPGKGGTSSIGTAYYGRNGVSEKLGRGGKGSDGPKDGTRINGGGGGGGGYYPGGGGAAGRIGYAPATGGGGGSNFSGGLYSHSSTQGGGGTGNGQVVISWVDPNDPNQPPVPAQNIKIAGKKITPGLATKAKSSVTLTGTPDDPDQKDGVRLYVLMSKHKSFGHHSVHKGTFDETEQRDHVRLDNLDQDTLYYLRIKTQDNHGRISPNYRATTFWTNRSPNPPALQSPPENAQFTNLLNITFIWAHKDPDPGDGQTAFRLRWRKAATPGYSAGKWHETEKETSFEQWTFNAGTFNGNTLYEWQVKTRDKQNRWGRQYSESRSFYVTAETTAPYIHEPHSGEGLVAADDNDFHWQFRDPIRGRKQEKADIRWRSDASDDLNDGENRSKNPAAKNWNQPGVTNSRWTSNTNYALIAGASDGPIPRLTTYARATVTNGRTGLGFHLADNPEATTPLTGPTAPGLRFAVTPGETVNLSLYLRCSANSDWQFRARFVDNSGAWLGAIQTSTARSLVAGQWKRINWTLAVPAGAVGLSALVSVPLALATGVTFSATGIMLVEGDAPDDYFDGDDDDEPERGVVYEWDNSPHNSPSHRIVLEHPLWNFMAGDEDTPGSEDHWLVPAGTFEPNMKYEWEVRTYAEGDFIPSDWSYSEEFWATAAPGSGAGLDILPSGDVQQSLGIGVNRVFIYDRKGEVYRGELTPLVDLKWGRKRDDISQCTIHMDSWDKPMREFLSKLRTWRHEMVVFRDGKRVWEGPIVRISGDHLKLEIEAWDVMAYVYRRIMRQGYNDSYRIINGQQIGQRSVVERAARIIKNCLAYDDPNVLPYLTAMENYDDATQSRVVNDYAKTAFDEIDDLAAHAGLDYTVLGRRIVLWDTHRAIGLLPEMRDGDFSVPPIVTEYGMSAANYFGVTNNDGVWGAYEKDKGDDHSETGWIEQLASAYGESEAPAKHRELSRHDKGKLEDSLTQQAHRNIEGRWPPPLVVRIPDNSNLSPDLNLGINQLVPGVWIPLRATNTVRVVTQMQKLDSVEVMQDAGGEKISVVMSPAPGADEDPDDTAEVET